MTELENFILQQEREARWIRSELKDSDYYTESDERIEMAVVKHITLTKTKCMKKTRKFGRAKYVDIFVGNVNFFKVEVEDATGELGERERAFVIVREYGASNLKRERKMTCDQANAFYKELKKDGYQ